MKEILLSFLIVFGVFLFTVPVEAVVNCPSRVESFENTQVQQLLSGNGRCYLKIHPKKYFSSMVYRDYLLTSDGLMMIFNSFSEDFSDTSDGAREFYFYATNFNGFQWSFEAGQLVVTGFNRRILKFSSATADIQSISQAVVQLMPEIIPENAGGFEILKDKTIYIDAGFKLGGSPSSDPKGFSWAKNPQGQSCQIANGQTYIYQGGSAFLKAKALVKSAVMATCPEFIWNN